MGFQPTEFPNITSRPVAVRILEAATQTACWIKSKSSDAHRPSFYYTIKYNLKFNFNSQSQLLSNPCYSRAISSIFPFSKRIIPAHIRAKDSVRVFNTITGGCEYYTGGYLVKCREVLPKLVIIFEQISSQAEEDLFAVRAWKVVFADMQIKAFVFGTLLKDIFKCYRHRVRLTRFPWVLKFALHNVHVYKFNR